MLYASWESDLLVVQPSHVFPLTWFFYPFKRDGLGTSTEGIEVVSMTGCVPGDPITCQVQTWLSGAIVSCSTSVRATSIGGASKVGGNTHSRKDHSNNRVGNMQARKRPEKGRVSANR
jgi:hypothetical protein